MNTRLISNVLKLPLMIFLPLTASFSFTAEKDFADAPLFLQSGVQPNIMFGMDDSGSMDWETVIPAAVKAVIGNVGDTGTVDIHPDLYDRQDVARACAGTNLMYYNHERIYTPWVGEDDAGDSYENMSITAALQNPYEASGSTTNLAANGDDGFPAGYFPWFDLNQNEEWDAWVDLNKDGNVDVWNDANGNNKVDVTFTFKADGTLLSVDSETEIECPQSSLGETILEEWFVNYGEMDAAEKQNFSNWYSYYRKREFVAKRALSTIVSESVARMGLTTLWDNNKVFTEVKDIDNISTPVNLTAESNKDELLEHIFEIDSAGSTPLRRQLKEIGRYFEEGKYEFDYRDGRTDTERSFTSPIQSADEGGKCQQNFAIIMSDGVWYGGSPNVGDTDSTSNSDFDGGIYADRTSASNTLADVAMHYYERDLRPTYDDIVPITENIDENAAQHLVTYTVAFGVSGTLDEDVLPNDAAFAGWPTPSSGSSTTIDDSWHAAVNGRGLYLNAQDPEELIDRLNASIQDIQERTGSASTVAVNSGSYSSLATVFQAQFNSLDWTGRLKGLKLSYNYITGLLEVDEEVLASVVPAPDNRHIVTYDGTTGVPFKWDDITTYQQSLITSEELLEFIRGDRSNEGSTTGQFRTRDVWNRACEPVYDEATKEFVYNCAIDPDAISPLGDIVHSTPSYVGEPLYRYPDDLESKTYRSYRLDPDGDITNDKNLTVAGEKFAFRRKPMIYVGANDGMLHGFEVDPDPVEEGSFGNEVFAFVPSTVMENLPKLARQEYRHIYTVDGSPYVGDAFFNDDWHTVLTAGLNSGGQGVYALNVSKPQTFTNEANAAKAVLWEFGQDADLYDSNGDGDLDASDLGFTFGQPIIAKSNTGDWVAIFGNGYNNTYADAYPGSGHAVLYVVRLSDGVLLKKIDTGINDLSTSNGLSSPTTVDINGDYRADYVYAGDLEGNMWKFDISATNPASWDVAFKSGTVNKPLYTACSDSICTTSNRQSITVQPQVTLNRGGNKGLLVYFGTGSYMFDPDLSDKTAQTLYGIWDKSDGTYTSFNRTHLLMQEIIEEKNFKSLTAGGLTDSEQRRVSDNNIYWHEKTGLPVDGSDADSLVDTHLGWYMDLYIDDGNDGSNNEWLGERSIVRPVLRGSSIDFNTLIPDKDPCSAGGDGWVMRLNPATGGQSHDPVIDVNRDGIVDENDNVDFDTTSGVDNEPSGGFKVEDLSGALGECVYMVLPDGKEVCILPQEEHYTTPTLELGRWTWREL